VTKSRDYFLAPSQGGFVFSGLLSLLLVAGCGDSTTAERSLDQVDPAKIPAALRFPNQPREVVAILTSDAGHIGIIGIAFSPDGTRLAGGFGSGDLVVWNSGTQAEVARAKAHQVPISKILFTPDRKTLITSSYDMTTRLWDIKDKQLSSRATLTGHNDQVWGASLSPDGKTLATAGSDDKTIRIWKIEDAPPKEVAVIHNQETAWSVSFAQDGRTLASTYGNDVVLWNVGGDQPERTATLTAHKDTVWRVEYSPNGKMLASTGRDKVVQLWNLEGDKPTHASLSGHDSLEIYGLAFSPDGKWLVSADHKGRVVRWDTSNGTERNRWQMPNGLRAVVFAPDSRHLALSCDDKKVYLLRLPD
jgi:WD40 repeat protein